MRNVPKVLPWKTKEVAWAVSESVLKQKHEGCPFD